MKKSLKKKVMIQRQRCLRRSLRNKKVAIVAIVAIVAKLAGQVVAQRLVLAKLVGLLQRCIGVKLALPKPLSR